MSRVSFPTLLPSDITWSIYQFLEAGATLYESVSFLIVLLSCNKTHARALEICNAEATKGVIFSAMRARNVPRREGDAKRVCANFHSGIKSKTSAVGIFTGFINKLLPHLGLDMCSKCGTVMQILLTPPPAWISLISISRRSKLCRKCVAILYPDTIAMPGYLPDNLLFSPLNNQRSATKTIHKVSILSVLLRHLAVEQTVVTRAGFEGFSELKKIHHLQLHTARPLESITFAHASQFFIPKRLAEKFTGRLDDFADWVDLTWHSGGMFVVTNRQACSNRFNNLSAREWFTSVLFTEIVKVVPVESWPAQHTMVSSGLTALKVLYPTPDADFDVRVATRRFRRHLDEDSSSSSDDGPMSSGDCRDYNAEE
jgi:hypothetical protein